MSKLLAGCLLVMLSACAAEDGKRAELPRMATSREMQVVFALVARYRKGDEDSEKYFKKKVEAMPVWSRMLPLQVLRTDDPTQRHSVFDGFAVPLKVLVSDAENGRQAFALHDSTSLLRQVRKAEILLDSTVFRPGSLLTPHLYRQPQVRRKVHGHWFYRFSQPLFSPDGNSAYVQADIAGSRASYKLLKRQGKWVVTHDALLWVE